MNRIPFKRGDTFQLSGTFYIDGVATALDDYTVRAQVRHVSTLVQSLTYSSGVGTGEFILSATADETASWPTGLLKTDIEFTLAGVVTSSEILEILVTEDVTQP